MFISFEGIEGCGKTTQVKRLFARLQLHRIPAIITMEPGGTRVGQHLRGILLDSENVDITPLAELLLYSADRAQHVETIILPALNQKKWVICDRFIDAMMAYQGFARGQDKEFIKILNDKACCGIRPDITFLIDCPVETGLKRANARDECHDGLYKQDRFERERIEFHQAVRNGYLFLASKDPQRFKVIDGKPEEDNIEEMIFEHLGSITRSGRT